MQSLPVILYRAAHVDGLPGNFTVDGLDFHVFQDIAELQIRRPVDHQAERPVIIVFAEKRCGVVKIGIG